MNDTDWLPDNFESDPGELLGIARPRRNHNVFEDADHPVLKDIGKWLASCPPDMMTGMAAHSGIMAGLALARAGVDIDAMFDLLAGRGIGTDEQVDDMTEMFTALAEAWLSPRG